MVAYTSSWKELLVCRLSQSRADLGQHAVEHA